MRIRHDSGSVLSIVDPDHGEHEPGEDGWFDVPHELGEKMCGFPGWAPDRGQDAEAVDVDENMELSVAHDRIAELEARNADLEARLAKATKPAAATQTRSTKAKTADESTGDDRSE